DHQCDHAVRRHRLSTIVAADKIVMLEDGKVVATGSHEELLTSSEPYRKLIRKQMEDVVSM
ncbi:MAG: ABC transporter ATP-binding protein, partial [Clostridia bacterium]|nr:ABC transporter ATP-binding protein [Clostridia bacterium]